VTGQTNQERPATCSKRHATSDLQKLCDKGVAKAKRNPSQSIGDGIEIYIAWIYQSKYIKEEDGIQQGIIGKPMTKHK